jgi:hypothetical protein
MPSWLHEGVIDQTIMTETLHRYRDYGSDFVNRYVNQGRAEGEAVGEANALLTVLEARGIAIPDPARDQITSCTDLDQLNTWLKRAPTVTTIDELLA